MNNYLVIVVFAPLTHADAIRQALADGGAGNLGEYTACSFTVPGQGRFQPTEYADPHIGTAGVPEVVDEVRIEALCQKQYARAALQKMLEAHPYEEPAYHCYQAILLDDLT